MLNLINFNSIFYRNARSPQLHKLPSTSRTTRGAWTLKRNGEKRYHGAQLTSRFNKTLKPAVCYHFPHKVSAGKRERENPLALSLRLWRGACSRSRGGQRSSVSNTVTFPDEWIIIPELLNNDEPLRRQRL